MCVTWRVNPLCTNPVDQPCPSRVIVNTYIVVACLKIPVILSYINIAIQYCLRMLLSGVNGRLGLRS